MENLFINCTEPDRVIGELSAYRRSQAETERAEGWDFEPTYPTKMMVSPVRSSMEESVDFPRYWPSIFSQGGTTLCWEWIQVVAATDCVDLALARWLSKVLDTLCVAIFSFDGADAYGYRYYRGGALTGEFSREMEERADYRANHELETLGIPYSMRRFRECSGPGWREIEINPLQ